MGLKIRCRSDPGAETVEVVSSLDGWKLPGFKLERYSFGEFACFLGQQEHFDEINFKVRFPNFFNVGAADVSSSSSTA